ncbi:MAG: hypothetical protein IH951_14810 [Bacteroidetes bacterium]|nr:hypothetical protein [Bacteroidota bacterium]
MMQQRVVKALGEIALREIGGNPDTQILALFDRTQEASYRGVESEKSTVDHFAFTIPLKDFDGEKKRIEQPGLSVKMVEHTWVHWRSL